MAVTKIADIIQPEVFTPYVTQKTMELSELMKSGIIEQNALFDELASGSNTLVNMPFWNDLTGVSEIIEEDEYLTPQNINANADVARKHGRAKAWGANNLTALLSGSDPMAAIGELVAEFWQRDMQRTLLSTLDGIFKSASMAGKVHDISSLSGAQAVIGGETFIDASQKMGDAKALLTAVSLHSAVEAYLAKRQLIEYVQEAGQNDRVPYFMNKRVVVDDGMPFETASKTGCAYIFGAGAVALGNGKHPKFEEVETARDKMSAAGEDYLINRKIYILHPRGVKWKENTVAKEFPSNDELELADNWERVYEPKKIRIVKFVFKID